MPESADGGVDMHIAFEKEKKPKANGHLTRNMRNEPDRHRRNRGFETRGRGEMEAGQRWSALFFFLGCSKVSHEALKA